MINLTKLLNRKNLLIIFLFSSAAFLRLWQIGNFDISPDEHHFINEAYRFITGDPYIVPRHHPFRHPAPFVGHPFLGGDLIALVFKIFGPSVASARAVLAWTNLFALLGAFILSKLLYGPKTALITIFLLTFLPHDVRYARDAHLDPLLGATLVWASICFWKILNTQKIFWGGYLGLTSALVFSTKINGPFLLFFYALALTFHQGVKNLPSYFRKHFKQLILALFVFSLIFFILVDPKSYLDALVNPADPIVGNKSVVIAQFLSNFYPFTKKLILHLYSLPFALLVVFGLVLILKRRSTQDMFLLSIIIVYSHIFITHNGHSGEYGYITLNPYFAILGAVALLALKKPIRSASIFVLIIFFIPLLILYGLRLDIGNITQLTKFNDSNFRFGQTTYKDAISAINKLPGSPTVLWIKDGDRYLPTMEIRGGVSLWPFTPLQVADTVLVADPTQIVRLTSDNQFFIYERFDFKNDILWILRRNNTQKTSNEI